MSRFCATCFHKRLNVLKHKRQSAKPSKNIFPVLQLNLKYESILSNHLYNLKEKTTQVLFKRTVGESCLSQCVKEKKHGSYGTLPVKLIPAKCSEEVMVSPKTGPSAGTNWMMLGGRPHSRRIL